MNILNKIILNKQKELEKRKKELSIDDLRTLPYFDRQTISLKKSLLDSDTGIIAEFKRKSPSKGWIFEYADVNTVTSAYSQLGASGISILTDHDFFGGDLQDLENARANITCPVLRKDFMIDTYQLYEAKAMGADVILLIAAALSVEQCFQLAQKAYDLSLEVLLEVHNAEELNHLNKYVDMVGVNNRNLKTFEVDIQTSLQLVDLIPNSVVKISESGISSAKTVKLLRKQGYNGFLMGENFMKNSNPAIAFQIFLQELQN